MTDAHLPDFVVNLAASLTFELLKAGGQWLKRRAFGTEQEQAIRAIYEPALARTLVQVLPEDDPVLQSHIGEVLKEFVKDEHIAEQLLGLAFKEDVSLDDLRARFDEDFDSETIDFDDLFTVLIDELEAEALAKASEAESPVFNQVIVAMVLEVRDSLRDLKSRSTAFHRRTRSHRKLFISYARKDGKDLAVKLVRDLQAAGFEVWIDLTALETGSSWSQELENAIRECDAAVVLLSEGSYRSEICRAEQIFCLDLKKPVFPLLVHQDTPRPIHLYAKQFLDFSSARYYTQRLDTLKQVLQSPSEERDTLLAQPIKPRRVINTAPQRPPNYIPRQATMKRLRDALLSDKTDRSIAITAISGMGGLGKSVLAAAIAYDSAIQAAYPDGIVWVSIGSEPSGVAEQMKLVGETLGDEGGYYNSKEAAVLRLRAFLPEKSALLILDDVWELAHIEDFRIEAPNCRTLVTTRKSDIARNLGATQLSLDVMTEEEAQELLASWTGVPINQLSQEAHEVAHECGYLPLALAMTGAMVKNGISWANVYNKLKTADLSKIKQRLPHYDHTDLFKALHVSVEELDAGVKERYFDLCIFREERAVPRATIEKYWQPLGLTTDDTEDLIRALEGRSLIRVDDAMRVTLHDLQLDYIRMHVQDKAPLHERLLNGYNPNRHPWHLIADEYLFESLVYHLQNAKREAELARLFANHDWMHVRHKNSSYIYTGYIEDLEGAWLQVADKQLAEQIVSDAELTALNDCVRYALIRTAINSLAGNYHPEVLAQAVNHGLWTLESALTVVLNMPDPVLRAQTYTQLLNLPNLPIKQQREMMDKGLQAALAIGSETDRSQALTGLMGLLTGEQKVTASKHALQAALKIGNEYHRANALAGLAAVLSGEQKVAASEHALQAALAVRSESVRADVLAGLAAVLSGEQVERALRAALAIGEESARALALAGLAAVLSGEQVERALRAALAIGDESACADVLANLAAVLSGEQVERALRAALALGFEAARIHALARLVPVLTIEQKASVSENALQMALANRSESVRAQVGVTGVLTVEQVEHALRAVLTIDSEYARVRALAGLAAVLTGQQKASVSARALQAALVIEDEIKRADALAGLAAVLSGEQKVAASEHALRAVLEINDEYARALALARLATVLTGEQVERAMQAALAITEVSARADALAGLVPVLSGEQIVSVSERALQAALEIRSESVRANVLAGLAAVLTVEQVEHALRAVLTIDSESARVRALAGLAVVLTGQQVERALQATLEIHSESARAFAFAGLAAVLSGEQVERALQAALAIGEESARAFAFAGLAAVLSGEQVERALRAALAIGDESARANALAGLAAMMTSKQVERAFDAALGIFLGDARLRVLFALLPLRPNLSERITLEIRHAMALALVQKRKDALHSLLDLLSTKNLFAPPVATEQMVLRIAEDIEDVATRWRWV